MGVFMKTTVNTTNAPAAIGPYSQATTHNGIVYVSGQLPINTKTGELSDGDIYEQTRLVMTNIIAIIEAAGSSMSNILKCTILLVDMSHFDQVNEAYAKFFPSEPPARICYQVTALPKGANIEIDCIAALGI
jgi:2-iminobutanoate/2-iminopropanoate deaminase